MERFKVAATAWQRLTTTFGQDKRHGQQERNRRMEQRSKLTRHQALSMGWTV